VFLLDTDTLTRLHAGNRRVESKVRRIESAEIAISIVTSVEVLQGRFSFLLKAETGEKLLRAQDWLQKTELLLSDLRVIAFDAAAASEFDRLRASSSIRRIGRADLLIASIAISRGATLVTRNLKHFKKVPGLRLENWID